MGLRVMRRILQGPAGPPGRKTAMGPDSRAGSRKGRCRETGARWLFLAWLQGIWQPPVQSSPLISLRFCFYTAFSHKQRNKSLEDWCWKACRSQTLFHPQWFQGQGCQQSHFFLRATATLSSKPSSLPTSFPRAQHLPGMQVEKISTSLWSTSLLLYFSTFSLVKNQNQNKTPPLHTHTHTTPKTKQTKPRRHATYLSIPTL